ncbi:hypothetical protein OHC33_002657 [Knufia fluminis]|uniref:Serine aminopeptidase S33 domain-containing protein n=1 Tax=Knufia fluminis TaxID=191047 RepID=A0AAN8EHN4_9EURO|nr:hypothetical protein OHC33_002657 [Knufia fluminis]
MLQQVISFLVFASGLWLFALFIASFPTVQRHVFYLHKLPIWWSQKLDIPESFGFLPNQVTHHTVITTDKERLFAWLVVPLNAYIRHEDSLAQQASTAKARSIALDLVKNDAESKLVIYFHGNASTVGSTRRTEAYRSISVHDPEHQYVLSFDYRGFGRSTGHPTQEGLVTDAVSVIEWARKELQIPYERILLLSQSLGTAVASATLQHYISKGERPSFAGLMMCAPFTNMADAFMHYKVFLGIELLAPLRFIRPLQTWFIHRLADKWSTTEHLDSILSSYENLKLTFVHCTTDDVIPVEMTHRLATTASEMLKDLGEAYDHRLDLGHGGSVQEWRHGNRRLRKVILNYGGMC